MVDSSESRKLLQVKPSPPPLRIHHFLACFAVASVQLAIYRIGSRISLPLAAIAFSGIRQAFEAAGLTLAIFSLYWHLKGYAALVQPGQWLLLSNAIPILHFVSLWVIGPMYGRSPWSKNILLWNATETLLAISYALAFCVYGIIPVLFFGWCAWRIADTFPWRFLFVFLTVIHFDWFLALFGISVHKWLMTNYITVLAIGTSGVLPLAIALWVAVSDEKRGPPRLWTHWAGLGLFIAGSILSVIISSFNWLGLH